MRRSTLFRLVVAGMIALTITAISWAGLSAGTFQNRQLAFSDSLFPAIVPDDRIVVVGIDQKSLLEIGQFPFDRTSHAELIEALNAQGASLIGYDVSFLQASPNPSSDRALAEAVAGAGNVVMVATGEFVGSLGELGETDVPRVDPILFPVEDIAGGAAVGHSNVTPDTFDGVVRTLPPIVETPEGEYLPSLSLQLFLGAEEEAGPVTIRPEGIQIGSEFVRTGRGHLLDINFVAERRIPTYSFVDVLEGRVPDGSLDGKIVLVGATALGLLDHQGTPIDKGAGQPGVVIHANALNTMLTGAYLTQEGKGATLFWVFALALLVALAVGFLRIWLSPLVAAGLLVVYVFVAFNRFDSGTVMNLVYPPLAILLAYLAQLAVRYFTEERERRRVTRVFGRYVAQDVVDEVLAAPESALATLEGTERPLTMLFADLRGFTSASEGKQPVEVVEALNVYLDAMTRAVNEEMGTIDKFMGDCVMAFWGAPRPTESHAERAVRAGIKMLDYIDEAVQGGAAANFKVNGCGVGIATGPAVVGNIGSADRLDYTVIGDTVNTASRICGVAGAGQVVVTEATKDELLDGFRTAPLPPLVVKGKVEPLQVFQVLREGQEAASFAEGATLDATEDKGHFEQTAPAKAAGYAPIEPVAKSKRAAAKGGRAKKATARKPASAKATTSRKRSGTRSRP
jgi:adenylate cyclase